MTQNLLPIRILFHSAFALVYLPTIILTFVLGDLYGGLISLSALGGLGIFAALDILTIRRKVNQTVFLCIDIFVAVGLPGCLFSILYGGISGIMGISDGIYFTYLSDVAIPLEITATVIIIALSTSYVLYIVIAAVIDKVCGNAFLPIYFDESSSGTGRTVFLGRRRSPTERATVNDHCASYIFQRSVFRKHAFEPTGWAIFRGIVAVYCCVGLLGFTAYIGYSDGETYANGGISVQESVLASTQVVSLSPYSTRLSVAMLSHSQSIPSDLTVSRWPGYPNLIQNATDSGSQFWTDIAIGSYKTKGYPFIDNNGFNVSWSGDINLDIWATSSYINGSTDSIPAIYSPGFPLFPFKDYVITLTIISYEMNGFSWLFLEPQIHSVVDSGSNVTMASFSCNYKSQRQITHRELDTPSGLVLFVQAISAIGGVYAFIDGFFAFIFGRTMLAILFGTRVISPFGLLGIITRSRYRRLINEQYPRLQEDMERGGMAAYVSEVAIDPGLILASGFVHGRSRVDTSSPGPRTDGYADADVIHLRSVELTKTGEHTSHSLPYAVEAFEPSTKYGYE